MDIWDAPEEVWEDTCTSEKNEEVWTELEEMG
jgi:hypothetical protein